ncbi:hypothetical protein CAMRE0001_1332 [Campylobacter rectus RM3267]|uniref:Uncharacterized protein n=1 Tax=Campylobacter rectus RM3267 TaxID=553218 RepID=B9D019_CAMRE|nr:hypothetical protein CAMRE0001_1332 [Campylobacter rectus RM3267]
MSGRLQKGHKILHQAVLCSFALPDSHYEAANLKNKWLKIRLSSVGSNKFCLRSVFSGNEIYPNFSTSAR